MQGVGVLTWENILVSVLPDVLAPRAGLAGQAQPAPHHGSLRTHRLHAHARAHRQSCFLKTILNSLSQMTHVLMSLSSVWTESFQENRDVTPAAPVNRMRKPAHTLQMHVLI